MGVCPEPRTDIKIYASIRYKPQCKNKTYLSLETVIGIHSPFTVFADCVKLVKESKISTAKKDLN